MKRYWKSGAILLILILVLCTAVSAYGWETYDYSRFDKNTYLYDIGGNFKNTDINYYNGVLKDMQSKYGITYTFVIVNDYTLTNDKDMAWDFAALIQEKAGYSRDYISVVVIDGPEERDFAVFTLGKGQQVMNDSYADGMMDSLEVDLKKGDWDGALLTFIDLAEKMTVSYIENTDRVTDRRGNTIYYQRDYHKSDYDDNYYRDDDYNYTFFDYMPIGTVIIVSAIIGLIAALIAVGVEWGKHKPVKKAVNADYYVKEENVKMNVAHDKFLRSHETKVRINTSSGSGGGRSGGSSFRGSSGRSGGGGSRRF